jgi:hypothetical protein
MPEARLDADDPVYLAAHLQERLAKDSRVYEPELVVTVEGERVVVAGVVPTPERRAAVTSVVREACPDHEIDNRTTVALYDSPAPPERIT